MVDSPHLNISIKIYEDGSIFVASQVQDAEVVKSIFAAALQALKDKDANKNIVVFH